MITSMPAHAHSSPANGVTLALDISTEHGGALARAREYGQHVPDSPSLDVRRVQFARFVRRAVDRAKQARQWTVERIASEAGIGPATIYRWLDGEWSKAPLADAVQGFCEALGIPQEIAFSILWPASTDNPVEPEPLPVSPAIEAILRKLADPGVPEVEKYLINQTLESLAARPRTPRM
jgi:transcriptional regulator with XRE-family HTH domain